MRQDKEAGFSGFDISIDGASFSKMRIREKMISLISYELAKSLAIENLN